MVDRWVISAISHLEDDYNPDVKAWGQGLFINTYED